MARKTTTKKASASAKKKTTAKKPATKPRATGSTSRKPAARSGKPKAIVEVKHAGRSTPRSATRAAAVSAKPKVQTKSKATTKAKQRKVAATKPPEAPATPAPPPPPAIGSFVWHELMTTDAEHVGDFYQGMFNWSRRESEMIPGVTYTTFSNEGKPSAGMMNMAGPDWEGQPTRWIPYVKVKSVDAATLKATQLGGRIIVPTSDFELGRFAIVADPAGATIGVFEAEAEQSESQRRRIAE